MKVFISWMVDGTMQGLFIYGVFWLMLRWKWHRLRTAKALRQIADKLESMGKARRIQIAAYFVVFLSLAAISAFLE